MKTFISLCLSLIVSQAVIASELPEPYASIRDLPFDDHGWFTNRAPLERLMDERQPVVIVELGAWLGLSTRFFAERVQDNGGRVYAVDNWLGPLSAQRKRDPRLPHLYQLFLSNIKHAGFADVVVPIRMDTLEAAEALDVEADMIYVDAAHDTQSVHADIMAWYPHLREGGLMCGDDWKWSTVRKGVERASRALSRNIRSEGNFWWFD